MTGPCSVDGCDRHMKREVSDLTSRMLWDAAQREADKPDGTDEKFVRLLWMAQVLASIELAGQSPTVAAIKRVRGLHLPCTSLPVQEGGCGPVEHTEDDPPACTHCDTSWPCPTIKALDGEA